MTATRTRPRTTRPEPPAHAALTLAPIVVIAVLGAVAGWSLWPVLLGCAPFVAFEAVRSWSRRHTDPPAVIRRSQRFLAPFTFVQVAAAGGLGALTDGGRYAGLLIAVIALLTDAELRLWWRHADRHRDDWPAWSADEPEPEPLIHVNRPPSRRRA